MKTILVPVEQHSTLSVMLETAYRLGQQFESYVEGMSVNIDLPEVPVMDIAVGVPSFWDPEARKEMADKDRDVFESFFAAKGVARTVASTGFSFGWQNGGPKSDTAFASEARAFDLAIVGRPTTIPGLPRYATVEAALFESGRPVLLVPPALPDTISQNILIAWNGSTETARTLAFARPFLSRATHVTVLALNNWGVPGPSAEQVARNLKASGLPAVLRIEQNPGGRTGETILEIARSMGCDLLIKGAYTQSRLRQMIFGGATASILSGATLPVLMAN